MADIPLDPRLQAQLLDLYRMSGDRIASTQPVHDAAMAMATRLAPGYARSAMRPAPTPSAALTTGSDGGSGLGTAGKITTAALMSLLANAARNGSGGDIGKLIQALGKLFRRGGQTGPDSGPASIPGGSSDFTDWAANTGTFNPEDPANASPINSGQFPGYSDPMADFLKTYDPGGSNFTGPQQPPMGGDPNSADNAPWGDW